MLQWKNKVQSAKMWKGYNFKYGVRENPPWEGVIWVKIWETWVWQPLGTALQVRWVWQMKRPWGRSLHVWEQQESQEAEGREQGRKVGDEAQEGMR